MTGRTDENTTCTPETLSYHSQSAAVLLGTSQTAPDCITGAHVQQLQWIRVNSLCEGLGSLLIIFLIQAIGKQQASLDHVSGQQMGASVPLRKELPTTTTHCLFLVVHIVLA